MTDKYSGMPNNGVTVDKGRVSDFLHDIQGSNHHHNRSAIELTVGIIAASRLARNMIRSRKARKNVAR